VRRGKPSPIPCRQMELLIVLHRGGGYIYRHKTLTLMGRHPNSGAPPTHTQSLTINMLCNQAWMFLCMNISSSLQVTAVGLNTEWGLLMASISEDNNEETPLQVSPFIFH
jgi:hypothetical protein